MSWSTRSARRCTASPRRRRTTRRVTTRGRSNLLLGAEASSAVRAAFHRLSAFDQEVLELRVVAGLSSDEVAAVLGKKSGAVRMAQARALERLRELLEQEEPLTV
ncbi:MAG: sigma factor-like helix-turn-helix DNA-binding protein [Minicystis sp.]